MFGLTRLGFIGGIVALLGIKLPPAPIAPGAIAFPFPRIPNAYIRGPKYLVRFDRIRTPRIARGFPLVSIRDILQDNPIRPAVVNRNQLRKELKHALARPTRQSQANCEVVMVRDGKIVPG